MPAAEIVIKRFCHSARHDIDADAQPTSRGPPYEPTEPIAGLTFEGRLPAVCVIHRDCTLQAVDFVRRNAYRG